MRENRQVELKERVTNTFLKTVSAYANYGTGEILFGVADDGTMVGLEDPTNDRLRIENAINDGISPRPEFSISENSRTGAVTLRVLEGDDKPYLYRSKAYKRSDASTVEVDDLELRRLVLEGSNLTFDAVRSARQDLSFDALSRALEDEVGVSTFGDDTLKTLGITDVLDAETANFSPVGLDESLVLSKAEHAARVKIDEDGCEAAAYTVMMMETTAALDEPETVEFTLDRPFLFVLTGIDGAPLFAGVVNQPNG